MVTPGCGGQAERTGSGSPTRQSSGDTGEMVFRFYFCFLDAIASLVFTQECPSVPIVEKLINTQSRKPFRQYDSMTGRKEGRKEER